MWKRGDGTYERVACKAHRGGAQRVGNRQEIGHFGGGSRKTAGAVWPQRAGAPRAGGDAQTFSMELLPVN